MEIFFLGRPEGPKCQCGRLLSKHDVRYHNNPDSNSKWKVETHTHASTTNAYGEIEFIGAAGAGPSVKLRKVSGFDPPNLAQLEWQLATVVKTSQLPV